MRLCQDRYPGSAQGRPRPALAFSFSPPLWPFSRQKVKNLPMTGLSAPHSSTLRARKKMNGTGSMLPMMEMMYTLSLIHI